MRSTRSQLSWMPVLLIAQLVGLMGAGWIYRDAINPDGIAYLRLASYYVDGPATLRVSGYWGPGLVWLLAGLMKVGCAPLLAARVAMGGVALGYTVTTDWFLRRIEVGEGVRPWLVGGVACATVLWSVENISPDLLVALPMLGLVGWMMPLFPRPSARAAVIAGLWGALGYYGKAVAGPFAVLAIVVLPWLQPASVRARCRFSALALATMGLLMAPWIGILSAKYGGPTLSTSARIVHATVGPGPIYRYPLGDEFEAPEVGRLTTWENPSLRAEQYWAPWDSWEALGHQLGIVFGNLPKAMFVQTTLFALWPGLLLFLGCALRCRMRGDTEPVDRRFWPLVVAPLLLQGIYLATLLPWSEQRYFFATVPMLAAATSWVAIPKLRWATGSLALFVAIVAPNMARWALLPLPNASAFGVAKSAAFEIERAGWSGPVAGSARMRRGRAGLFMAYYLDQPWYGDAPDASVADYLSSGARLFAIRRGSLLHDEFLGDDRVVPVDGDSPTSVLNRGPMAVYVRADEPRSQ